MSKLFQNDIQVEEQKSVLLIFTGGTISMAENPSTGALYPIDFERLIEYLPELKQTGVLIKSVPFSPLIDSSDIDPDDWKTMDSLYFMVPTPWHIRLLRLVLYSRI